MDNISRSMRRRNVEKAEATREIWSGFRKEWVSLQAKTGKHIRKLEAENTRLREQLVICHINECHAERKRAKNA